MSDAEKIAAANAALERERRLTGIVATRAHADLVKLRKEIERLREMIEQTTDGALVGD